jgi:cytochrome P450
MAIGDRDAGSVDVMDVRRYAQGPPHELFAAMRAEAPVSWSQRPDGGGFWSVTGHAEIAHVSKHPELFSSAAEGVFLHRDQAILLDMDPPRHASYRKIVQTVFTPRTVSALEGLVRGLTTPLLDAAIEKGRCDWATDIATPLPLGVLTSLMALPQEAATQLHAWTETLNEACRAPEPAAGIGVTAEMGAYLHAQIERQIEAGVADSLVMRLHRAEVDGERLTDVEIVNFFCLLTFAGNDTVRNTATAGMNLFLDHPDQWRLLCQNPALMGSAVEEVLRCTSVVQYFKRTAVADVELGGQHIKAGDPLILWYPSGSRDTSVFADPDVFDITRTAQDHMAFGGGGRHFCLGAGLARLELRVLFEEATRRIPDIARDGAIGREPSSWTQIINSLPVRFTPGEDA